MQTSSLISQAFSSIYANKGRSFLTTLGIIIGIASVIALIGIGTGAGNSIEEQVSEFSSNNITIRGQEVPDRNETEDNESGFTSPGQSVRSAGAFGVSAEPTLTIEDIAVVTGVEGVVAASPEIEESTRLKINEITERFNLVGASESYSQIEEKSLRLGRELSKEDVSSESLVAVVGSEIAVDFFDNDDQVIGGVIEVGDIELEIIGVYEEAESTGGPGNFGNPDEDIFIPYTVSLSLADEDMFGTLIAQAQDEETVKPATDAIEATLLTQHGFDAIDDADFQISTSQDFLDAVSSITSLITAMLAGIAAISLLVGGIGIMNIMLVSVTERTREIGLRKAVGAKTRHVLWQFLTESIVLTLIGGVFGILVGILIGRGAGNILDIQAAISAESILLAVGVSSVIGVVFGIYPAYKAARLDPIDALRYE